MPDSETPRNLLIDAARRLVTGERGRILDSRGTGGVSTLRNDIPETVNSNDTATQLRKFEREDVVHPGRPDLGNFTAIYSTGNATR